MGEGRRQRGGTGHDDGPSGTAQANAVVTGKKTAVWNHDFLNKKPWHPLNRQNQERIFLAEQEFLDRKKREDASRAEFEAEQQYLETLAHLPGKEADKYRSMQGVSWMYIKPPGLTAGQEQQARDGASGDAGPSRTRHDSRSDHKQEQPQQNGQAPADAPVEPTRRSGPLKREERGQGTTRALQVRVQRRAASPPIGGTAADASCHELVVEDTVDADAVIASMLARAERAGSAELRGGDSGGEGGADAEGETVQGADWGRQGEGLQRYEGSGGVHERSRGRDERHVGKGLRATKDLGRHRSRGERKRGKEKRRRGDGSGGDAASDDSGGKRAGVEGKEKKHRSHKRDKHKSKHSSKHNSKHKRHKSAREVSPADSGELKEALDYLIQQGVNVSQMLKDERG